MAPPATDDARRTRAVRPVYQNNTTTPAQSKISSLDNAISHFIDISLCDQCRSRKIRCDKEVPCSNCRISFRSCSSTESAQRPREHRQRVLISEQYEKKIDLLADRLANIENLLKRNIDGTSHLPGSDGLGSQQTAYSTPCHQKDISDDPTHPGYHDADSDHSEEESAAAAQTVFASEFLEAADLKIPYKTTDPNILAALGNLRQLVSFKNPQKALHEVRFPNQGPMPTGGHTELQMPPVSIILESCKVQAEDELPCIFSFACTTVLPFNVFSHMCLRYIHSRQQCTIADMISINCGLYYVLVEKSHLIPPGKQKEETTQYQQLCQRNLEVLLGNLPLFLPADYDTIRALSLGSIYAVDSSRMSLGWQLTVAASQLAQTLGYHHISSQRLQNPNCDTLDEEMMFWHIYSFDKALVLRLGRMSTIPDSDITIPRTIKSSKLSRATTEILNLWVDHAVIQHRMYQELYSTSALLRPRDHIRQSALSIAGEIRRIIHSSQQVCSHLTDLQWSRDRKTIAVINSKSNEVTLLASLTLVYRAMPSPDNSPGRFCQEAITTARETLMLHLECLEMVESYDYLLATYVHWAIMLTPFAPFFVLICHVIESLEVEDLHMLNKFVSTLELSCAFSESVRKLHTLCRLMCSIAKLYLEAKIQQQTDENFNRIGDEFEMYLSQLGFMPTEAVPAPVPHQLPPNPMSSDQATFSMEAASLGEWYSGSKYMTGLLEERLPEFDPMEGV